LTHELDSGSVMVANTADESGTSEPALDHWRRYDDTLEPHAAQAPAGAGFRGCPAGYQRVLAPLLITTAGGSTELNR